MSQGRRERGERVEREKRGKWGKGGKRGKGRAPVPPNIFLEQKLLFHLNLEKIKFLHVKNI